MLKILDVAHFVDTIATVAKMKPEVLVALRGRLEYLDTYACPGGDNENSQCMIGKDSTQCSFSIAMYRRNTDNTYSYWFNGGLIFYGEDSEPYYGVHT